MSKTTGVEWGGRGVEWGGRGVEWGGRGNQLRGQRWHALRAACASALHWFQIETPWRRLGFLRFPSTCRLVGDVHDLPLTRWVPSAPVGRPEGLGTGIRWSHQSDSTTLSTAPVLRDRL